MTCTGHVFYTFCVIRTVNWCCSECNVSPWNFPPYHYSMFLGHHPPIISPLCAHAALYIGIMHMDQNYKGPWAFFTVHCCPTTFEANAEKNHEQYCVKQGLRFWTVKLLMAKMSRSRIKTSSSDCRAGANECLIPRPLWTRPGNWGHHICAPPLGSPHFYV